MGMRQLRITNSITSRESQSLEKYLQEISRIAMISPEEEVELAIRIKKGDKAALERLIKVNLRFVVSVAKQYQGQGLSLSDLINEGNMGLIKAAERFDDTRGFKFISFAVWWIRQNILQALAEHARMIRLPLNKVALGKRIHNAHARMEQQLERQPSPEELAEILGVDLDDVKQSLSSSRHHVSLDSPVTEDEEGCLLDTLENYNAEQTDKSVSHTESLQTEIARCLRVLNEKQRLTICYLYGIGVEYPMSMEDIARKFDVTLERVRQIKEKAIDILRNTQQFTTLRSFLG